MSDRIDGLGDNAFRIAGVCDCKDGRCGKPNYSANTSHQKFVEDVWQIMDELGNLLISKQLDYGPGNINNAFGGPINGLLVRMGDKFERLKNLFRNGEKAAQFEPVEDSFKDLANYAVIGLMVKRNKWPANKENK